MSITVQEKLNDALKYHQGGDFISAEKIYKQILEENPSNADALNLLGLLFAGNNKYEEAINLVEKAVKISPNSYFYLNLGTIYTDKGDIDSALKTYETALNLESKNPGIFFGMAQCYKRKNDFILKYNKTYS